MTNFLRRDHRIMSNARLRATSSAVKILAWLVIHKLFTTSPLTAAAAVPLRINPFWHGDQEGEFGSDVCQRVLWTARQKRSFGLGYAMSEAVSYLMAKSQSQMTRDVKWRTARTRVQQTGSTVMFVAVGCTTNVPVSAEGQRLPLSALTALNTTN